MVSFFIFKGKLHAGTINLINAPSWNDKVW